MSKTPLIVWEKWIDPFGSNLSDAHWTDYESKINKQEIDDSQFLDEEEEEDEAIKPIRAIATPMGIIPYNEVTAPSHLFNFWVGHTNFNLSKNIVSVIERSDGVEILDIFSRYRFRIGVGKCFSDSETMKTINDSVYREL